MNSEEAADLLMYAEQRLRDAKVFTPKIKELEQRLRELQHQVVILRDLQADARLDARDAKDHARRIEKDYNA